MVSPEPDRPLAFLCHSSGEKERVRTLYHQLKRDGYKCWFDEEDLIPGQNWEREIDRALRGSDYVIVCLSQSSITKRGFVQNELKAALDLADELPEGEVFLIPVRLEPCQPPDRLRPLHWVDLFTESGYRQLTRALQPRGISNATVPASAWDRIIPPQPERRQRIPWLKYRAATTSVFISYRRSDEPGTAGRLYDRLQDRLGKANVFMDVDSIELGIDFLVALERAIAQVQTLIVIIGREWLTASDAHGRRRIDNTSDYVRLEIETALRHNKTIIPVLVNGSAMPPVFTLPASLESFAKTSTVALSHKSWATDVANIERMLLSRI